MRRKLKNALKFYQFVLNLIFLIRLTPDEYKQLTGNINEVLDVHQQLLSLIESESTKPGLEQRVGRLFLTWASRVKNVYQIYCSLHPRAVCILDKYK